MLGASAGSLGTVPPPALLVPEAGVLNGSADRVSLTPLFGLQTFVLLSGSRVVLGMAGDRLKRPGPRLPRATCLSAKFPLLPARSPGPETERLPPTHFLQVSFTVSGTDDFPGPSFTCNMVDVFSVVFVVFNDFDFYLPSLNFQVGVGRHYKRGSL